MDVRVESKSASFHDAFKVEREKKDWVSDFCFLYGMDDCEVQAFQNHCGSR